ncbi:carbohydrate kinase [Streptomyces sp. NPDC006393]|uniref:carbohydrate kinase family protein n=1 Tax=Streptomyces sp. NPDC006393 TaxID=3156763 RepID=UPI0034106615
MTAMVVGEVLVDLVWRGGERTIEPHAGGSPANVAIGLHRLDHPVRFTTSWGDDPPGDLIAEHLAGAGVVVDQTPAASDRTLVALAYVDEDSGSARYDFLGDWAPLRIDVPLEVTLLQTGSLAIVKEPGAARVREAARTVRNRPGGIVAVDLNVRPAAQPDRAAYRESVHAMVREADVVKASDEDLAWLYPDTSPERAARALLERGPRLAVVTCGGAGAYGVMDGAQAWCAPPAVDVVDTIGAGDSFQAALLSQLWCSTPGGGHTVSFPEDEHALTQLLRRAVTAGALACERAGAQPPTSIELQAALAC